MLQRSWTKHGPDAFTFEVLEVVENATELLVREQHWIDALNAYDWSRGLNGRPNASSPRGHKMGPEARANMSAAQKGKRFTPEHAAKIAVARDEGRKQWLAKIRSDPEAARMHSEKLSNAFTGLKRTPEHVAKIVLAHRGKIVSPETRAKQSEAQKERYRRDTTNGASRFGRSVHPRDAKPTKTG
jgi:group I intron endonuclease